MTPEELATAPATSPAKKKGPTSKRGTRRRPLQHIPLAGIAWLTREEVCANLRIEKRVYMRLVEDGLIRETRLGRLSIRIASTELQALPERLAARQEGV